MGKKIIKLTESELIDLVKKDYFKDICDEHQFQTLTESNKQSNAFRKGIYLTNVEQEKEELHFNLLRFWLVSC